MVNIIDNFDLSVIIPFYKKYDEFEIVIKKNQKYLQRNGIEVIIVLDEPSEQIQVLKCIKNYYFINWKIIVNEKKHDWRNPSKVINVGIRNSTKKYVLVISPESEFYGDTILELRKYLDYYPDHFAIGNVIFANIVEEINDKNIQRYHTLPFGTIMIKKEHLIAINGYNENLSIWGFDDVDVRARLNFIGIKALRYESAIVIHREFKTNSEVSCSRNIKNNLIPIKDKIRLALPSSSNSQTNWGNDFNKILYDWGNNVHSAELCTTYLQRFDEYYIDITAIKNREHKIIALVQSYNESEIIAEFLEHIEMYCDGIILLDDGSEDDTFLLAESKKIILKVKKSRERFNDLENRNILLNLGSFFSAEWFYFIDVDERFSDRYESVYDVIKEKDIDSVSFNLVHLWDREYYYRKDYPYSQNGVQRKWRMFRNYGRMQINSNQELHFQPIPYCNKKYDSCILIYHYGMLKKENREKKYLFYLNEDKKKNQSNYDHLISEKVSLDHIANIKLADLL